MTIQEIDAQLKLVSEELGKLPGKPGAPASSLKYTMIIFAGLLADKMIDLKNQENMTIDDAKNMGINAGDELAHLVYVYTGLTPKELFK